MKVHLIAIGGAVMHNLAIALVRKGFQVTGSDDEIFDPAKSHLNEYGLLPEEFGWYPKRITSDLDAVILGMHAKPGNPELDRALELGLKIYSFPEYLYEQASGKTRVVIGGSHGKTTITAMILHVLNYHGIPCDYLVGAKLEGFDVMVRLTDAPVIVIEGDEYLTSALDPNPKFLHYHPNIALISGIAWDHINVFPTYDEYLLQFEKFIRCIEDQGTLIYCSEDNDLAGIVNKVRSSGKSGKVRNDIPYGLLKYFINDGITYIDHSSDAVTGIDLSSGKTLAKRKSTPLQVFGRHNILNINGARFICRTLGVSDEKFFEAITIFKGASNRLELIAANERTAVYKDFAHAPSKLKATVEAVKEQFPQRTLVAVMELHTYSSLSSKFLEHYAHSMDKADIPLVFFDPHAIALKKLPPVKKEDVSEGFRNPALKVFTNAEELESFIRKIDFKNKNLLMMSSGNFGGLDVKKLANDLINQRVD